jgi:hypothetical protein
MKEWIAAIGLALLLFGLSYTPFVRNYVTSPKDLYYIGSIDYPLDLVGNLTYVMEGYRGHWQKFQKYTTTQPDNPTWLKFEYMLVGQSARLVHADPLLWFYVTRFLLSVGLLTTVYFVLQSVFSDKNKRVLAFALSLFATGISLPWLDWPIWKRMSGDGGVWQRITAANHHYVLGSICVLLAISFFAYALDHPRKTVALVFACIFLFVSTMVFAPGSVLVLCTLPIFVVLRLFQHKGWGNAILTDCILLAIFASSSLLPFLYIHFMSGLYEYNQYDKTELLWRVGLNAWEYLLAVGPVYVLSLFAIPTILKKRATLLLLFVPWIIVHPLVGLLLASRLGFNPARIFFSPYYVIYAVLATVGLITITKNKIIAWCIVAIIFGLSYQTYAISWEYEKTCFCEKSGYDYGYPKKDVMNAIFWLRDNTKENDIVLSAYFAGTLIPSFAGNRAYNSWWFYLTDPPTLDAAYQNTQAFYSGNMSTSQALSFLQTHHIRYVFWGEHEREFGKILQYPFLKGVYKNASVSILTVF